MLSESKYLADFLVEFLGKKPQTLLILLPYYMMIPIKCKIKIFPILALMILLSVKKAFQQFALMQHSVSIQFVLGVSIQFVLGVSIQLQLVRAQHNDEIRLPTRKHCILLGVHVAQAHQ